MQRLSIPLKTGQQTTRLHGRVVWPMIGVVAVALVLFACGRLYVGRTMLFALAPSGGTVIDLVGDGAIKEIAGHLSQAPLLNDKPLTLLDLLPYIHREVAYVTLTDGSHQIAFTSKIPDDEAKTLQNMGILITKGNGLTILSEATVSAPIEWKPRMSLVFGSIWPGFAGEAKLDGRNVVVRLHGNGISLGDFGLFAPKLPTLPSLTIAWMPFDANTSNTGSYIQNLTSFGLNQQMMTLISGHSGSLLLTKDDAGIGYRLLVNAGIESQALTSLLQSSMTLATPTTQTLTLPDGTLVDELHTDVALVNMKVEETAKGVVVSADEGDLHLRAIKTDHETIITNRESLLDLTKIDQKLQTSCAASGTGIVLTNQFSKLVDAETFVNSSAGAFMRLFNQVVISGSKIKFCW